VIELTRHAQGIVLKVRAQPGARKNAVLGERAGALRVAVSAAPEKGKANAAILGVLAEALGCKPSQLELVSGESAREKKVLVSGSTLEQLRDRLERLVAIPGKNA
jgi:uncharacterized protein (TIGR00251 family)